MTWTRRNQITLRQVKSLLTLNWPELSIISWKVVWPCDLIWSDDDRRPPMNDRILISSWSYFRWGGCFLGVAVQEKHKQKQQVCDQSGQKLSLNDWRASGYSWAWVIMLAGLSTSDKNILASIRFFSTKATFLNSVAQMLHCEYRIKQLWFPRCFFVSPAKESNTDVKLPVLARKVTQQ